MQGFGQEVTINQQLSVADKPFKLHTDHRVHGTNVGKIDKSGQTWLVFCNDARSDDFTKVLGT